MSTLSDRIHALTLELLSLLESEEATTVRALEVRGALAEATAESGRFEDAFYQADELLKDAQREHGPDSEHVAQARASVARIEALARAAHEG